MNSAPHLLILTYLLLGCSSGQTAFRRGDYAEAVQKASQRLNQNPGISRRGHELAGQVIQEAFVKGYTQHQTTIRTLSGQREKPFRWETVFAEYTTLQQMTTNARKAQPDTGWLTGYPVDCSSRLAETRELAADERYTLAETAFVDRQINRMAARDAYEQYQKALSWVPNYRQAAQRSLEAFPYAVLRVLIEPPVLTPELDVHETNELAESLFYFLKDAKQPSPYVHLYNPNQTETTANGQIRLFDNYPINESVQIAVTQYVPYLDGVTHVVREVESDNVYKIGQKRINDSTVVDVMGKVKGLVTLYTRTLEAHLGVQWQVIDRQTDQVRWQDNEHTATNWQTQWETFEGDKRALNGRTLLTATILPPPSRRDMLGTISRDMGSSLVSSFRQCYKNQ